MKVKNDHRSKFSNLSNWKEEAWKKSGLQRDSNPSVSRVRIPLKPWYFFFRLLLSNCLNWKIYCDDHSSLSSTTAVQKWIISYTSHHFTPHGRYELNKLTSLPMCGFTAQLVEPGTHRQRGGHGLESRWSPDFFQASFQLLKLENLLRWSFFTSIYNRSSKMNYFIYTSHQ